VGSERKGEIVRATWARRGCGSRRGVGVSECLKGRGGLVCCAGASVARVALLRLFPALGEAPRS
jgi:hypothetical protein